jgi:hypothetical protein
MIASLTRRRPEILARAVRDNLADCLSTLPGLIERNARCSLHFYFANFEGMRRTLFPRLVAAYRHWRASGDTAPLLDAARIGTGHWTAAASRLIELHRAAAAGVEQRIEAMIDAGGPGLTL